MKQSSWLVITVIGLLIYCLIFPGSTWMVSTNSVPIWGLWMGGALLMLQGGVVVTWLIGQYGWRGLLVALLAFFLAWGVEHIGETSGLLFGRYQYTEMLQPQILGVVPIPITCAWLMVVLGAWQLSIGQSRIWRIISTATLVVILDLQIETVATKVNSYWQWFDRGPYYGVPTLNFIGWWGVGLVMGLLLVQILVTKPRLVAPSFWLEWLMLYTPALLYLLSTCMFSCINLSRGYTLAGMIGIAVIGFFAIRLVSGWNWNFFAPAGSAAMHQTSD